MKALVVYDSFFGNTEKIAQAVGKGLGSEKEVEIVKVGPADHHMLAGIDLLVVGSPTRGFSPSPGIKSFLKKLPAGSLQDVKVAAFDTRIPMGDNVPGFLRFMVKLFGYADKPMMELLIKKGGRETLPPEGFFVLDSEGPLKDGELTRAEAWAKKIRAA